MNQNFNHRVLDTLLGSQTRARVLRFFFRHENEAFRIGEVAKAISQNYNTTASFVEELAEVGILKEVKGSGTGSFYGVSLDFRSYPQLKELVLQTFPIALPEVVEAIKKTGRIRLALIQGVFLGQEGSSIDLFVVADDIDQEKFAAFVKDIEGDVGKELNYTLMDTPEFTYRYNIYDRFVRNLLKKPNIKLVDSLSL